MDKQFVNGIRAFKPNEKAPSFVKANLTVNKTELLEWLDTQPDEIRVSMKESQKGSYYLEVDSYQRQETKPKEDEVKDDLPF